MEYGTTLDFDDPQAVSCQDAIADEIPYYSTECVLDEDICPPQPGGGGGFGTGPGDGSTSGGDASSDGALDDTTGSSTGSGAGGPMTYGLQSWAEVVTCSEPGRCSVALGFVDDLLLDLSVLEADAIALSTGTSPAGHRGFVFDVVGPDSLPAVLGLEPGDVLWRVEDIELRSLADVARAFEELSQARHLGATVDRGSETLTLRVRLVEELP